MKSGQWSQPTEEIIKVPIALWPKDRLKKQVGGQMLCNLVDGLNSFGAEMLEASGMGKNEAQNMITRVDEQYRDSKWELSMNMYTLLVRD